MPPTSNTTHIINTNPFNPDFNGDWKQVNDDIRFLFFRYLTPKAVFALSQTCTAFYQILENNNSIWISSYFQRFPLFAKALSHDKSQQLLNAKEWFFLAVSNRERQLYLPRMGKYALRESPVPRLVTFKVFGNFCYCGLSDGNISIRKAHTRVEVQTIIPKTPHQGYAYELFVINEQWFCTKSSYNEIKIFDRTQGEILSTGQRWTENDNLQVATSSCSLYVAEAPSEEPSHRILIHEFDVNTCQQVDTHSFQVEGIWSAAQPSGMHWDSGYLTLCLHTPPPNRRAAFFVFDTETKKIVVDSNEYAPHDFPGRQPVQQLRWDSDKRHMIGIFGLCTDIHLRIWHFDSETKQVTTVCVLKRTGAFTWDDNFLYVQRGHQVEILDRHLPGYTSLACLQIPKELQVMNGIQCTGTWLYVASWMPSGALIQLDLRPPLFPNLT